MQLPAKGSAAQFRNHRSIPLDCLRAFAVFAVLVYHVGSRYDDAGLDAVARLFQKYGNVGVDIFFPLSGYLIVGFLLRAETREAMRAFFLRRLFRIVPLYMAAVLLYVTVSLIFGIDRELLHRIWITLLFLTGWAAPAFPDANAQLPYTITWSLSVEESAYILFGLGAWLLRRHFVALLAIAAVVSLLLRGVLHHLHFENVHFFPPARLDSIAIGGLVAVLVGRGARGLTVGLVGLALLASLLSLAVPSLSATLRYSIITFLTCSYISLFETELRSLRDTRNPLWRGVASLGFYSYFIYLFHLFNIEGMMKLQAWLFAGFELPFWLMVLVATALTWGQAVLSFRWFEGPLLRYGRSLERSASTVSPSPRPAG